jgi:hypothetical protein
VNADNITYLIFLFESQEQLKEAKLSTFSKYDKIIPAHRKGLNDFLYGITDEMKKSYRLALLNADLKVFFFLILGLVICE